MVIRWRNGGLIVGRDWYTGPRDWCIEIYWSDREALTGAPTPEGQILHADSIAIRWVYPPLRLLRRDGYRMHWRATERAAGTESADMPSMKVTDVAGARELADEIGATMRLPEQFAPAPYISGDTPDWHAGILREIARQLGVGSDAYYPLLGAANKIEMLRRGASYAEAVAQEGDGKPD